MSGTEYIQTHANNHASSTSQRLPLGLEAELGERGAMVREGVASRF